MKPMNASLSPVAAVLLAACAARTLPDDQVPELPRAELEVYADGMAHRLRVEPRPMGGGWSLLLRDEVTSLDGNSHRLVMTSSPESWFRPYLLAHSLRPRWECAEGMEVNTGNVVGGPTRFTTPDRAAVLWQLHPDPEADPGALTPGTSASWPLTLHCTTRSHILKGRQWRGPLELAVLDFAVPEQGPPLLTLVPAEGAFTSLRAWALVALRESIEAKLQEIAEAEERLAGATKAFHLKSAERALERRRAEHAELLENLAAVESMAEDDREAILAVFPQPRQLLEKRFEEAGHDRERSPLAQAPQPVRALIDPWLPSLRAASRLTVAACPLLYPDDVEGQMDRRLPLEGTPLAQSEALIGADGECGWDEAMRDGQEEIWRGFDSRIDGRRWQEPTAVWQLEERDPVSGARRLFEFVTGEEDPGLMVVRVKETACWGLRAGLTLTMDLDAAQPVELAAPGCPAGLEAADAAMGLCCWPGQKADGGCQGVPSSCPRGLRPAETGCVEAVCPLGMEELGGACCWAGQGSGCTGTPSACPQGWRAQDQACVPAEVPDDMVAVPPGSLVQGCEASEHPECHPDSSPAHQVRLSGFLLDRHEVGLAAYGACVEDGGCQEPQGVHDPEEPAYNWGAEGRDAHPVNGVTWEQAAAYCAWVGKRLPTSAEWERAARGDDGRRYPWGSDLEAASCTCAHVGPDGCGTGTTAPVGSYPSGVGPFGAQDLAGNVWEFVSDGMDTSYYHFARRLDPQGGTWSGHWVRGGGFRSLERRSDPGIRSGMPLVDSTVRAGVVEGRTNPEIGFRCARDVR